MKLAVVVTTALLLAHTAFLAYGPQPRQLGFQSGAERNRHVLETFPRDGSGAAVTLVGSSMAARLGDPVIPGCARNIAMSGESSATGLDFLGRLDARPTLVLVEINVPERRANVKLAAQGAGGLSSVFHILQAQNMPANLMFSFLLGLKPVRTERFDARVLATGLAVQRPIYDQLIDERELTENIKSLSRQVVALEKRGARVIFFELPIHPSLEDSPRARQIRRVFSATFPGHRMLWHDDLIGTTEVRTTDAIHLLPEESAAVSEVLRQVGSPSCSAERRIVHG